LAVAGSVLYAWGYNSSGQLGDGTQNTQTSPESVAYLTGTLAAGYNHNFISPDPSQAFVWGENNYGQLGDGGTTDQWSMESVSSLSPLPIRAACGSSHTLWLVPDTNLSILSSG